MAVLETMDLDWVEEAELELLTGEGVELLLDWKVELGVGKMEPGTSLNCRRTSALRSFKAVVSGVWEVVSYIYIYVYMCVCVCELFVDGLSSD